MVAYAKPQNVVPSSEGISSLPKTSDNSSHDERYFFILKTFIHGSFQLK